MAIQEKTSLSFAHGVADGLSEQGMGAGYQAHSTLFVEAESPEVFGLIAQESWIRETKKRPGKATRHQRSHQERIRKKKYMNGAKTFSG